MRRDLTRSSPQFNTPPPQFIAAVKSALYCPHRSQSNLINMRERDTEKTRTQISYMLVFLQFPKPWMHLKVEKQMPLFLSLMVK